LRERDVHPLDVGVLEAALEQRLMQHRFIGRALRDHGDLLPLQVGQRLESAAVDEVLAHHQRFVVVAVDAHALVGHDPKLDAAIDRVVETRRGGAAAGIERAGAERHDHLGT